MGYKSFKTSGMESALPPTKLNDTISSPGLNQNNTFVINPMIYAECSVGFEHIEEVEALFKHLGFESKPIPKEALFLAGKAFLQNKKCKEGKNNVLPDFFIGAHAAIANYQLITRDKGRFNTYKLMVIKQADSGCVKL